MMDLHYVALFAAALAAGAINSVAGGGTLLTFPALVLVLGPGHAVLANGTSTVALVPGSLSAFWGYRTEMADARADLRRWAIPSLLGGALGAWLAVHLGDRAFSRLVPYLILGATGLFLLQGPLRAWLDSRPQAASRPSSSLGVAAFQFIVAVYGGFFGAGIGILMLAAMGILGQTNIHRMNGLKNFAAMCINGVAAATFIWSGRVRWELAGLMMGAAIVGGYAGAGLAKRVGQANVRRAVVAIGLAMGVYTLVHQV